MNLKYNPFNDIGITNYEQYKAYPFLVFGTLEIIKNRIKDQINQIKNKYYFSERLILLGERGIGKTSTMFFINDVLNAENIETEVFSRLIEDAEHFETITGEHLSKKSENPIYLLIDFPDTIETKKFKRFLEFLWYLMTHKNYNKINMIFSMNKSHFEKSFDFSEIFGKFTTIRLEKLGLDETEKLIESRLKIAKSKIKDVFEGEVVGQIFSYSKGIPRNIVSACNLLISNADKQNGKVSIGKSKEILKERYTEQVINDRVQDLELRRIYKLMCGVLEKTFDGTANSQEDYIKKVVELCGIGRNSAMARIKDLVKFGIFNQYKGGYNRVNKIISFS